MFIITEDDEPERPQKVAIYTRVSASEKPAQFGHPG